MFILRENTEEEGKEVLMVLEPRKVSRNMLHNKKRMFLAEKQQQKHEGF